MGSRPNELGNRFEKANTQLRTFETSMASHCRARSGRAKNFVRPSSSIPRCTVPLRSDRCRRFPILFSILFRFLYCSRGVECHRFFWWNGAFVSKCRVSPFWPIGSPCLRGCRPVSSFQYYRGFIWRTRSDLFWRRIL